jgi:hypothetical protein
MLTNITPLYQSELVPVGVRARAVGFTVAGYAEFSVIATVVVWASQPINNKWQYLIPLIVQAAAPVVLLALSFLLTESPTWLLSKGRTSEAKVKLASLRAGNMPMVEAELSSALVALREMEALTSGVQFWDIFKGQNLERTLSSGALYCMSQVGGQILVSTYSTVTLIQSGVADPFKITIIIFMAQFVGTTVGPPLVDKLG